MSYVTFKTLQKFSFLQDSIEKKYSEILQLAKQRRQYLVFAYSMFLLYREAGGVRSWIQEKVSCIVCLCCFQTLKKVVVS